MKLSKNFTKAELCKSQTATRMGLNNNPTDDQTENLRLLCERVLQPIRDHFNQIVSISSGFGVPNHEVSDWIKQNLMFDQLILEFYKPGEPNSGWIHVSYCKEINRNRKEYLMALLIDGKVTYKPVSGLSTDRYVK